MATTKVLILFSLAVAAVNAGNLAAPVAPYAAPVAPYVAPVAPYAAGRVAPYAGAYGGAYGGAYAPGAYAPGEYDPNPQYSYSYQVAEPLTGDFKDQQETRNGDVVQGRYSLLEADGSRRVVEYTADPVGGFNAVVSKEGGVAVPPGAAPGVTAPVPFARPITPAVAPYAGYAGRGYTAPYATPYVAPYAAAAVAPYAGAAVAPYAAAAVAPYAAAAVAPYAGRAAPYAAPYATPYAAPYAGRVAPYAGYAGYTGAYGGAYGAAAPYRAW